MPRTDNTFYAPAVFFDEKRDSSDSAYTHDILAGSNSNPSSVPGLVIDTSVYASLLNPWGHPELGNYATNNYYGPNKKPFYVTATGHFLSTNNPNIDTQNYWDVSMDHDYNDTPMPVSLQFYVWGGMDHGYAGDGNLTKYPTGVLPNLNAFSSIYNGYNGIEPDDVDIPFSFCHGSYWNTESAMVPTVLLSNSAYTVFNPSLTPQPGKIQPDLQLDIVLSRVRGTGKPDSTGYWQLTFLCFDTSLWGINPALDTFVIGQSIWRKKFSDSPEDSPIGDYTWNSTKNLGSNGIDTLKSGTVSLGYAS